MSSVPVLYLVDVYNLGACDPKKPPLRKAIFFFNKYVYNAAQGGFNPKETPTRDLPFKGPNGPQAASYRWEGNMFGK